MPAARQVVQVHEGQHIPVDGQERLEIAVHLVGQDRHRVGIQPAGCQHACQGIEVGVLVSQDDGQRRDCCGIS